MIRAYEQADVDEVIRVWLASTIPGQSFLPEEHWRAEEREVREELMPVAETWVVEEAGELVAFMSLLGNMIGGLFTHPDHQGRKRGGWKWLGLSHPHTEDPPLSIHRFHLRPKRPSSSVEDQERISGPAPQYPDQVVELAPPELVRALGSGAGNGDPGDPHRLTLSEGEPELSIPRRAWARSWRKCGRDDWSLSNNGRRSRQRIDTGSNLRFGNG